ncbi:MAG TPA: hypothetical protein VMF69_27255 [Gemmataceae bacterium]|nr:hypothetical protein [Gemmataceae bacterium]
MTLEERAQKVRKELFERYDQLNALWLRAEEKLTRKHVPHPVVFPYLEYEPDYREPAFRMVKCLGLQKISGKWRICYGEYASLSEPEPSDWTPITDCSAVIRVEASKHCPKFEKAVVESAEQFIPKVDSAIQQLSEYLGQPENLTGLLAERSKLNGGAK